MTGNNLAGVPDNQALRASIHKKRGALSNNEIAHASERACKLLGDSSLTQNKQHIAFYYSYGGEINPKPLLSKALSMGKHCYLPVLRQDGTNQLDFAAFQPGCELKPNRYGIPEPAHKPGELIRAQQLELVLLPLTSYDLQGNRVGMGKGYYDRTFAFLKNQKRPGRPLLIGLAYSFQQVSKLTPQNWDIPLDGIVNEQRLTLFTSAQKT